MFCRVRPVSQEELDLADAGTALSFDSDDDAVLYLSSRGKVMTFELDKVFPPQASQEEVRRLQNRASWFLLVLVARPGVSPVSCSLIGPPGVPGSTGSGHFLYRRLQRLHLRVRTDGIWEDLHHGGRGRSLARPHPAPDRLSLVSHAPLCPQGVTSDPGINQRALRLLFAEVTEKTLDWEYRIVVNLVEIYNETLR